MNLDKYPIKVGYDYTKYEFVSDGPLGQIQKVVIYSQIEEGIFNLAFGDWLVEINKLDDTIRTNNNDRDKILATVAATAIDFTNEFPGSIIYTEGSTPARTRLYQMAIAGNLEEISDFFEIDGYLNGKWEPFQRGRGYSAFLAKRKQNRKFE